MKEKGITLIALIITIIIMLILATVTFGAINGGLFDYAGRAKKKLDIMGEKEAITSAYLTAEGLSKTGRITEADLKKQTDKYENIEEVTSIGESFVIECTSGNQYILDKEGKITEKKGLLAYEIPSQDYGNYVFNYSDIDVKDGGTTQLADWQVFYAGKVSNEAEDHIYLIASNVLNMDSLPLSKNENALGEGSSQYHAHFGSILADYPNGSDDVQEETKYLNSGYFEYLDSISAVSKNNNMKDIAYMCDTSVWNIFKTNKADFVIGGPTLELLFKSYNKKYGTNYLAGSLKNSETAEDSNGNPIQTVNNIGYKISLDGGTGWLSTAGVGTIRQDTTYKLNGERFWLASPSTNSYFVFRIDNNGQVDSDGGGGMYQGFRPIVRLKASTQLEKIEGGYRIVE